MLFVIEMRLIEPRGTTVYWYGGTIAERSRWVIHRRHAVPLACKRADALIDRLYALVKARGHYDISFHRQAIE